MDYEYRIEAIDNAVIVTATNRAALDTCKRSFPTYLEAISFLHRLIGNEVKEVDVECTCVNPGVDDGGSTCWAHHDCDDGDCTHRDGEG